MELHQVHGLRRQLAGRGTHVLEVLPPVVDTPATAHNTAKKIPPEEVATATLRALAKRRPMALPGQTRFLPLMLRLAPKTIRRMVAEKLGAAALVGAPGETKTMLAAGTPAGARIRRGTAAGGWLSGARS